MLKSTIAISALLTLAALPAPAGAGEKNIALSFAKTNPLAADFECELRFYEPAQ